MNTVASEWTKLWSVRSTWWSVVAALALMAAASAQIAIYVVNGDSDLADAAGRANPSAVALDAFSLAQLAVIALAMLVMTAEYQHGTMRATLSWTPSRGRVLAAKAGVVGAVTLVVGLVLGVVGTAAAWPVLGEHSAFDAGDAAVDAVAMAGYAALVSLLTLGVAAALRGAVLTLVTIFLLFFLVPPLLLTPDEPVLTWIADLTPGPAGAHFLRGDTDPYPPLVGVAVLVAWALAALAAGLVVMRRRDA